MSDQATLNGSTDPKPGSNPHGSDNGWQARLQLGFDQVAGETRLFKLAHDGPLRVQKPFYPGSDRRECHVYLLHPPGGFVGNDQLEITGALKQGAHALLTTPSAGKFYRTMPGRTQKQRLGWTVGDGACLAWLPQENVFFRGCQADLETRFNLQSGAHLFAWDISVFGRKASGEKFDEGRVSQSFTVNMDDRILLRERFLLNAGAELQTAKWGLQGHHVMATALLTGPAFEAQFDNVAKLVERWGHESSVSAGATHKRVIQGAGVIIVRYLGAKVSLCKAHFEQLQLLLERESTVNWLRPRIWNT